MYSRADAYQPFFDLPPAIGFSLSRHTLSLRSCITKLDGVSFSGLVFSTAYPLVLVVAFKSPFKDAKHLYSLCWLHGRVQE